MSVRFKHKNPGAARKIAERYKKSLIIAVGYPSSKTKSIEYPDGTSLIQVAAENNFGVPERKIPARPFMRLAKEPATKKIKPLLKPLFQKLNRGRITIERIAETIAPVIVSEFKSEIVRLRTPPNAPSTIAKKKSSNPLIGIFDLLKGSLTFEIRKKKKGGGA